MSALRLPPEEIAQAAFRIQTRVHREMHRHVVIVSGSVAWCDRVANALLGLLSGAKTLFLSHREAFTSSIARTRPNETSGLLGVEYDWLLADCLEGLWPDALAAAVGTVVGGGVIVLFRPHWGEDKTGEALSKRLLAHEVSIAEVSNHYTRRFWSAVSGCRHTSIWDERLGSVKSAAEKTVGHIGEQGPSPRRTQGQSLTRDQATAVEIIEKVLLGRKRRPLVLMADRGRGKSSALGIALSNALAQKPMSGLIVAPTRRAVKPLIAQLLTSELPLSKEGAHLRFGSSMLYFATPAELASELPPGRFVFVDEAAAIPVPLLKRLTDTYNRLVFSSTTHGYEGTGQGFVIRFAKYLSENFPSYRCHKLIEPIRWPSDEAVEESFMNALGLSALTVEGGDSSIGETRLTEPVFEQLRNDADPAEVDTVFALLKDAHYRTAPMDLARLYDAPNTAVWCARIGQRLVGAAVVVEEGALTTTLANAVADGRRRLRGHLFPQTMAAHLGLVDAAQLKTWRVARLAVAAEHRRRGYGAALIDAVRDTASQAGVEFFATSFGATSDLLSFWHQCGLTCIRLGTQRSASSSLYSVVMAEPLSSPARVIIDRARERLWRGLPPMCSGPQRDVESDVLIAVSRCLRPSAEALTQLSRFEVGELERFISRARPFEVVYDLLSRIAPLRFSISPVGHRISLVEHVWMDLIMKGHTPAEVARRHRLNSGAAVIKMLSDDLLASGLLKPGGERTV